MLCRLLYQCKGELSEHVAHGHEVSRHLMTPIGEGLGIGAFPGEGTDEGAKLLPRMPPTFCVEP